jgi:hypothetical protein
LATTSAFGKADPDALEDGLETGEVFSDEDDGRPAEVRRRSLREHLMEEINQARDNLTRYIFQTVSIGAIGAGTIVHYMAEQPYLGTAAALLLPIILITSKLATTNYEIMHRNLGYLLHLERTRDVPPEWRGRWHPRYRHIGWEEAMRAWRVVQPTLFNKIMWSENWWRPWRYQTGFDPHRNPKRGRSHWYAQRSMIGANPTAHWRPGGSLKVMQYILTSMAVAVLLIMALAPVRYAIAPVLAKDHTALVSPHLTMSALGGVFARPTVNFVPAVVGASRDVGTFFLTAPLKDMWWVLRIPLTGLVAASAGFVTLRRLRIDRQRRKVLEDGLLSIHACAILWQAVAVAHYEAIENARVFRMDNQALIDRVTRGGSATKLADAAGRLATRLEPSPIGARVKPDGAGLPGYTFWLAQEARSLAARADDIHGWIGSRDA